ncbi:MAG: DMT family protein [Chitinophagaceae bacterium]|nr:DMT family protein [Chitinophagaceae bacterium]
MRTILLLLASNIFMTIAWYGHLKNNNIPLWKAILVSWGIAFFEYCLMVPANRFGYTLSGFSAFQLKIIQEVITLLVFTVFAVLVLKEKMEWRYLASFACVMGAVYFAFKK